MRLHDATFDLVINQSPRDEQRQAVTARSSMSADEEKPNRKANEAWRVGKALARFHIPTPR